MTTRLLALTLCLAGCASIATSPVDGVTTREVALLHTARRGPTVYTARLIAEAELAQGQDGSGAAVADSGRSSGTLRLVVRDDNTFEYQLTIYNDRRSTFTQGTLYRGTPAAATAVAALFAGEAMSSRYIQLRGTGSVTRSFDARVIMDQVRESPEGFIVRIDSRGKRGGALQGALR